MGYVAINPVAVVPVAPVQAAFADAAGSHNPGSCMRSAGIVRKVRVGVDPEEGASECLPHI